jgi:hypothetical protein
LQIRMKTSRISRCRFSRYQFYVCSVAKRANLPAACLPSTVLPTSTWGNFGFDDLSVPVSAPIDEIRNVDGKVSITLSKLTLTESEDDEDEDYSSEEDDEDTEEEVEDTEEEVEDMEKEVKDTEEEVKDTEEDLEDMEKKLEEDDGQDPMRTL